MKTVILCGGKGTRMREETEYRPKPLVPIGEKPILWHIMKTYAHYGFRDFVLCVGYKGDMIKRFFMEMQWLNNSFTINTNNPSEIQYHTNDTDSWNVTIVDTGEESQTGKRIKQIEPYIQEEEFMLTYGDGLCNVNVPQLIQHHHTMGKIATLTGVQPSSQFGVFQIEEGIVTSFREKPMLTDRINGGYMVLNRKVFDFIPENNCAFEQEPLRHLGKENEIALYAHDGFWTAIDTYKDVERVNELWNAGKAEWNIWQ